eukprot:scaffold1817_cov250-Pinguiococcus_pyrenoidosus.AAC.5
MRIPTRSGRRWSGQGACGGATHTRTARGKREVHRALTRSLVRVGRAEVCADHWWREEAASVSSRHGRAA